MGELAEGEGGTSRKSLPLLSRDRLRPAFALQPAPLSLTAAVASEARLGSGSSNLLLNLLNQAWRLGVALVGTLQKGEGFKVDRGNAGAAIA